MYRSARTPGRPSSQVVALIGYGVATVALVSTGVAEEKAPGASARGPLRVLEENPIYFIDGSGRAVYLTGSHTWNNFQDSIKDNQPRPEFDYAAYLSFLKERGHNFIRLWTWEGGVNDVRYEPLPYVRTESGKFDLDRFNEAYFERLRARVTAARDQGIYVSVMLFQGWSIYSHGYGNPWPVHPFHAANNVNGIDGDRDKDGEGKEVHSLEVPAVTRLQEAYLRKVIDTVNDLDNVLYEVTNETAIHSKDWQYHIVKYVQEYEKTKPKRHPIGMTAFDSGREGSMDALFRSPADWISPQNDGESGDYMNDPPAADGRKVIISDTDHLWGVGGGRDWVWKSFTRGHQPIYMDPLKKRDQSTDDEPEMEGARSAMGQTRRFAERMTLRAMKPAQELASTRYCLADPGREYLVYLPEGGKVTVDLSPVKGDVTVEWLDPARDQSAPAASVSGGARRGLEAPFSGPAVLYVKGMVSERSATPKPASSTRVVSVTPPDGATDVDPRTIVEIHFSTGLKLATITTDAIRLLGPGSSPVPARLGHDIEGDVVNVQPGEPLQPRTAYSLEVTARLMDKEGAAVQPFSSRFTTGAEVLPPAPAEGFRFTRAKIDDEKGPTSIVVGPDGNLYVSTYYGMLYRLRISPETGRSTGKEQLLELPGRKILGLTFDPEASASDPVAWITYDERRAEDVDEGTFSGVLSRVRIPAAGKEDAVETRCIIGLPSGWHPLNGCAFGPDGRLYISVGSMNRLGDDPRRPETPLSAAVLVADVRSPGFNGAKLPLNAQTSAPVRYDPWAEGAPLRVYATGFREMYGPAWHSNGSFYGGVNQNDGTGRADTPAREGVPSLRAVFPDEDLVRIVEGAYYGHPNPSRKEYVLLGGNPTAGPDPWEIAEYPVGVEPDPDFHPENLIFNLKTIDGTSANGCAEYTGPGPLGGRLLVCFYEGTHTVHTFAFSADGKRVTDHRPLLGKDDEPLKFTQPLDIAVHPGGRIYVADFGEWASFGGGGVVWVLEALGG